MSSVWDGRADAYRVSPEHRDGLDLDRLVEWSGPGEGRQALDVATGGGNVARRLREAGFAVTTTDASPGMRPDVVCRSEDLPFADSSFDVVAVRIAPHHYDDVAAAVAEMARVSSGVVLVEDTLYTSDEVEEAERLRDPTHVRSYTEAEWAAFLEAAGLEIEEIELFDKRHQMNDWLARTGCEGHEADRVRALLADRTENGFWTDTKILIRARKKGPA
jgi:SAM-dependent methyltransferase